MNARFTTVFLLAALLFGAPSLYAQTLTNCLNFNDLPPNTFYNANYGYEPGDVFLETNGVTASVGVFTYLNSPPFFGDVRTSNSFGNLTPPFALGQGIALGISNATVTFNFPAGTNSVCFSFWDGGGQENIAVNGQPVQILNFLAFAPANIAPGVTLSVNPAPNPGTVPPLTGTICLTGNIQSLLIGGQEFFIDNVCYTQSTPPCPALNLQVTPLPCTPNGIFYATVNPGLPANNLTTTYRLYVNGELRGTYPYAQGNVNVGPFTGNGTTTRTFVIVDSNNPACTDTVTLAPINCSPCNILELEAHVTECTDQGYNVFVDFALPNPALNQLFRVTIAGEDYGTFNGQQFPLIFEGVNPPTDALTFEVQVCLVATTPVLCCRSVFVDIPDCDPDEDTCIEFEDIEGDAYGASQGNQPGNLIYTENNVTVRLLPFQDLDWITSFEELRVEQAPGAPPFAAASGNYLLLRRIGLSFNFSQYPTPVDSVTLDFFNQGQQQVNIAANGSPVLVLPNLLPGSYNIGPGVTMTVILNTNSSQQGRLIFTGNIYSLRIGGALLRIDNLCIPAEAPPCEISEMRVEALPCTTASGQFFVRLDFDHENTSGSFALYVNNNLPVFYEYSQLPLLVGPFQSPSQAIIFRVVDAEHLSCGAIRTLPPYSCNPTCNLSNARFDDLTCNNATYNVVINFDHTGAVSDSFRVRTPNGFDRTFAYADLPIHLTGVPLPTNLSDRFQICDTERPDCCVILEIDVPCLDDCLITDFNATAQPCTSNGSYFVRLNFGHQNTSGGFQLRINGQPYGQYEYADLPITVGPFPGNGQTTLNFRVQDNLFGCVAEASLAPVNCNPLNCTIGNLEAFIVQCSNTAPGYLYVNFNAVSTIANNSFQLYINNFLFGTYSLTDLPLMLPWPFLGASPTAPTVVRVCLTNNQNCCAQVEARRIDCNDSECIEFEELAPESVFSTATGYEPGALAFTETGVPVRLRRYRNSNAAEQFESVFVSTSHFGSGFTTASGQYLVLNRAGVEFDFEALNEQVISVCFNFYDGGGIENLSVNGQQVLFVQSLFQLNGQQVAPGVFLQVQPSANSLATGRVCLTGPIRSLLIAGQNFGIDNVCYNTLPPAPCSIAGLTATPTPCEQGQFFVVLNFQHNNTGSQGFTVRGNGVHYGTFSYAELPVTLGPFSATAGGQNVYEFVVRDVQLQQCFAAIAVVAPICNPVIVWPGDANSNNLANHFDLLNVGVAYGFQGPPRPTASNAWSGMPVLPWLQSFSNTGGVNVNYAHADCNGDGVINAADVEVIRQNYGLTHGPVAPYTPLPATPNNPPLFVNMPDGSLAPGAVISAPIVLGRQNLPVEAIYGLAFRINFDPEVFVPNSVQIEFLQNTWLGANTPATQALITIDRSFAQDGYIEVAISRINQLNAGGFGPIARFRGIIDDIAGLVESQIQITDIRAIRANETPLALYNPVETFNVSDGVIDIGWLDLRLALQVYPNPTRGEVFIDNKYGLPIDEVRVLNDKGMQIGASLTNTNRVSLEGLPAGVYVLSVRIGEHLFHKRVVKG